MTNNELIKELNRMGKGWFIVRLSNDLLGTTYDLKSGYKPDSYKTKESVYKRTLPFAKRMLKMVESSDSKLLGVESLGLTNTDVLNISKDLRTYFSSKPSIKGLKTKAARGIAAGDVANPAVRNILSGLADITDEEIYDSEEFFDWKCPYTGRDLKAEILGDRSKIQLDHIVPQNRVSCGLNVAGNLIYADKQANHEKGDQNFEDYINSLPGISDEVKKERIQKIKDFQKHFKYDPDKIKKVLAPILDDIYNEVCKKQKEYIDRIQKILK